MLKSSSFSLLYPTNWKTETEKKFDSCKYNSLKTFLNRFIFGVYSELRHLSLICNCAWNLPKVLSQETSISKIKDKKYFANFDKFSKIISVFRRIEYSLSLMVFPGQVR